MIIYRYINTLFDKNADLTGNFIRIPSDNYRVRHSATNKYAHRLFCVNYKSAGVWIIIVVRKSMTRRRRTPHDQTLRVFQWPRVAECRGVRGMPPQPPRSDWCWRTGPFTPTTYRRAVHGFIDLDLVTRWPEGRRIFRRLRGRWAFKSLCAYNTPQTVI